MRHRDIRSGQRAQVSPQALGAGPRKQAVDLSCVRRQTGTARIAEIKDWCQEPPSAVELKEVGSYRFFGQ